MEELPVTPNVSADKIHVDKIMACLDRTMHRRIYPSTPSPHEDLANTMAVQEVDGLREEKNLWKLKISDSSEPGETSYGKNNL
jgi:hypothetical protein